MTIPAACMYLLWCMKQKDIGLKLGKEGMEWLRNNILNLLLRLHQDISKDHGELKEYLNTDEQDALLALAAANKLPRKAAEVLLGHSPLTTYDVLTKSREIRASHKHLNTDQQFLILLGMNDMLFGGRRKRRRDESVIPDLSAQDFVWIVQLLLKPGCHVQNSIILVNFLDVMEKSYQTAAVREDDQNKDQHAAACELVRTWLGDSMGKINPTQHAGVLRFTPGSHYPYPYSVAPFAPVDGHEHKTSSNVTVVVMPPQSDGCLACYQHRCHNPMHEQIAIMELPTDSTRQPEAQWKFPWIVHANGLPLGAVADAVKNNLDLDPDNPTLQRVQPMLRTAAAAYEKGAWMLVSPGPAGPYPIACMPIP